MRLVWISHDTSRDGGAELALLEAVKAQARSGHTVHVVVPWYDPYAELVRAAGAEAIAVRYTWWIARPDFRSPYRRARRLGRNLVAAIQVAKHLGRLRPDVVITNSLASPVGALAAAITGIPHVWYIHEYVRLDHGYEFDLGEAASMALANMLSDQILLPSKALSHAFEGYLTKSKVTVVHPFIPLGVIDDMRPEPGPSLRLVLVGRIVEGKGQEDAVKATAVLRGMGIDAELILLGREVPGYGSQLRHLCAELGLDHQVRFAGYTPNPHSVMRSSDIVLVCSRSEAFGRVTIEALLLGKPVVGARGGATSELIMSGVTGLLYEAGNPSDLAEQIRRLHEDRHFREEIAQRGRSWACATFRRERYIDELSAALNAATKA